MFSHRKAYVGLLLLAAVLIAPLTMGTAVQPARQAAPAPDLLATLNDTSRAAYRNAREELMRRAGPVLIFEFDVLVLKYGIQRFEMPVVSDQYTTLKSISHVPLAIFSLLSPSTGVELSSALLYDLRTYSDQVKQACGTLAGRGLETAQLDRQNRILAECQELLADVERSKKIEEQQLTAFTRKLRPLIDENTMDAARAQIALLDERVKKLRAGLRDDEWKRLTVIVLGSQLPRKNNLAVQYFARLLGEPGECRRIIYAEGLNEQRALDLFGTYLIDTRIGTSFFDDSTRMYRDLLGDAAKQILDEKFKEAGR
jgi:hypothetical protein